MGSDMIDKESWERLEANNAAKVIQNCWRSHVDRKIFGFYKNLVGFHSSKLVHTLFGDKVNVEKKVDDKRSALITASNKQCALTIMRMISPVEAQYMDEAAGTHIRFRLASPGTRFFGSSKSSKFGSFPPAVYYKIYTHRPVIDLGMTAPRDYTKAKNKNLLPKQKHNHINQKLDTTTQGWYRRYENNHWRPIADKVLLSAVGNGHSDVLYSNSLAEKRIKKHNRRKYKRVQWLQKLYHAGVTKKLTSEVDSDEAEDLDDFVQEALDGMYEDVIKQDGIDKKPLLETRNIDEVVDDEDIQALIDWTSGLDYNDYNNYWSHLGTAGFPSVEILGEKKNNFIRELSGKPSHPNSAGSKINKSTLEDFKIEDLE